MSVVLLATLITWMRAGVPSERVYEVAAHPAVAAVALAALDSGVYRTTDAGAHWQRVSDHALYSFTFNPFDTREVCATTDGFREPAAISGAYCSEDYGATWSPIGNAGIFLIFDRGTRDRMYAGVGYGNQWISVSNDHGKTWKTNGFTAGHPNFHGWAATDRNSNVFVTSWPHGGLTYNYDYWIQPVYRSRDSGNTWQVIGQDPDRWVVANDATIYFAVGVELRMSLDAGTTFERRGTIPLAWVEDLAANPTRSRIVYAAGDDGGHLFESLDAGATWRRIDGDAFRDRIVSLSAGADGTVYVATYNALFTMRVAGKRRGV